MHVKLTPTIPPNDKWNLDALQSNLFGTVNDPSMAVEFLKMTVSMVPVGKIMQ